MKRKLIILLILFLCSGCDATYDLTINSNNEIETTKIVQEQKVGDETDIYAGFDQNISELLLALSKDKKIFFEEGEPQKDIDYYSLKNISFENHYSYEATGVFKRNAIADSSIIYLMANGDCVQIKQNFFIINVKKVKAFEIYDALDTVTVNINVNNKSVITNNADKVDGNVYTWFIDRNNYENKSIEMKIKRDFSFDAVTKSIKRNGGSFLNIIKQFPNIEMAIICIFIVLVGLVLYLFFKKKQKKVNGF